MFNTAIKQHILKTFATILKCPRCGSSATQNNMKIVDENHRTTERNLFFKIHTQCPQCEMAILTSMWIKEQGIIGASHITDLTVTDVLKINKKKPISADDVIEIHKHLQKS